MAQKIDYKKLWEQQKQQNILLRTENERLFEKIQNQIANIESILQDNTSWEQLYNKQQGKATGIMECFEKLLTHKNKTI